MSWKLHTEVEKATIAIWCWLNLKNLTHFTFFTVYMKR